MYQILMYRLTSFLYLHIKIALNFKSQGIEKFELFSQDTYNFHNLRNETLVIADYEYAKIFSFALFDMRLWLKEENILLFRMNEFE